MEELLQTAIKHARNNYL